jgi:hypothetical protein
MAHTKATRPLDPDPLVSTVRGYRPDTLSYREVGWANGTGGLEPVDVRRIGVLLVTPKKGTFGQRSRS